MFSIKQRNILIKNQCYSRQLHLIDSSCLFLLAFNQGICTRRCLVTLSGIYRFVLIVVARWCFYFSQLLWLMAVYNQKCCQKNACKCSWGQRFNWIHFIKHMFALHFFFFFLYECQLICRLLHKSHFVIFFTKIQFF